MNIKAEEISKIIRDQIGSYAVDVDVADEGVVPEPLAVSIDRHHELVGP